MRIAQRLTLASLIVLVFLLGMQVFAQPAPPQHNPAEAQRALGALNQWRLERDYWPLRHNDTLQAMALAQAEYILSLPQIPAGGDIHKGRLGENVRERALFSDYNWAYYGRPERVAVTEIAYVGAGVAKAITFWQESEIHRRSVENGNYREVGIAALPHRYGHLYVVVLGSRPNVLPTLYDARTRMLHLSNELTVSTSGEWLDNATQIRLFDEEGRLLHAGWLPWVESMPVPDRAGDRIFVAYANDRGGEALSEVRLDNSNEVELPITAAAPQPTATPAAPQPISTSAAPPTSTPAGVANNPVLIPTLTPIKPTDIPPTPTPTATPSANLLLLYHSRSMVVLNMSRSPLNISSVVLTDGTNRLQVAAWNTQYLSGTLDALPAGDCLQGWSFTDTAMLNQPPNCRYRRSVINLNSRQLFWTTTDFQVLNGTDIVGQCSAAAARCELLLPQ